jgi:hypothetical protein
VLIEQIGHGIDGHFSECSALAKHSAQSSQIRSAKSLSLQVQDGAISVQSIHVWRNHSPKHKEARGIGTGRVAFGIEGAAGDVSNGDIVGDGEGALD